MPLNYASSEQASAHRFMRHRTDTAVARHTVTLRHDPSKAYVASLAVGLVIALILVGATFLVKLIRPASRINDAQILADNVSGALYVRVGEGSDAVIHPVLNLASARLIAGQDANPAHVASSELHSLPQGPLMGIPGAPTDLTVRTPLSVGWAICDRLGATQARIQPRTTIVIATPALGDWTTVLANPDAALMHYQNHTYLVTDGHRSELDRANRALTLALGISASAISTPMSRALYDALAPTPPLTIPTVPGAGTPVVNYRTPMPLTAGTVLTATAAGGDKQYFLALPNGVQQVPPTVAAMLRNISTVAAAPVAVSPAAITAMPAATTFDLSFYPVQPVRIVNQDTNPFTCVTWRKDAADPAARIEVVSGRRLPIPPGDERRVIDLAARGPGIADAVYMAPDCANFVQVTGNEPASDRAESLWWITDAGVRHGIATTGTEDSRTRAALGLTTTPTPAPWVVLRWLPAGLTLSHSAAMAQHDAAMGPLSTPSPRPGS